MHGVKVLALEDDNELINQCGLINQCDDETHRAGSVIVVYGESHTSCPILEFIHLNSYW